VEHGILVLEPDDEPVGDRHPLAFLPEHNSNRIGTYVRARQPTMPNTNRFGLQSYFIKYSLCFTIEIISPHD
jgi:hypothetical protein